MRLGIVMTVGNPYLAIFCGVAKGVVIDLLCLLRGDKPGGQSLPR